MNRHISTIQKIRIMCAACLAPAILFFNIFSSLSFAQENLPESPPQSISSLDNKKDKKDKKEKEVWSNEFGLGISSNTYEPSSSDYQSGLGFVYKTAYSFNSTFSSSFKQASAYSFTENDAGEKRVYKYYSFDNSHFGLTEKLYDNDIIKTSLSQDILIPILNSEERKESSLQGGFSVGPTALIDFEKIRYLNGFSFSYTLLYSKLLHRYETKVDGKQNTSYSVSQLFKLAYKLSDKWTADYDFMLQQGWSYKGRSLDPKYKNTFTISYAYTEKLNYSFEVSNGLGQNMYQPNGVDSNYKFYDKENTNLELSIGYRL